MTFAYYFYLGGLKPRNASAISDEMSGRPSSGNLIKANKSKKQIIEEEVANFQKALSEDEVKRLLLDEGLTETQRCIVLLKKPELDQ